MADAKPLTITEVDQWPPLGPMNLDPQRVRDVLLELDGQRERAEAAEAQFASVAAERAKRAPLVALLKECSLHLLALHLRGESQTAGPLAARVGDALKAEAAP